MHTFLPIKGAEQFSVFSAPLPDPYPPTVPPDYSFLHRAISLGDFNGDGFVDAAIATVDSGTGIESVQILLGNGDGTFALGQLISPVAPFPGLIPVSAHPDSDVLLYADYCGCKRRWHSGYCGAECRQCSGSLRQWRRNFSSASDN
jgi:hypothetical protein